MKNKIFGAYLEDYHSGPLQEFVLQVAKEAGLL